MNNTIHQLLTELSTRKTHLQKKDFLLTWDKRKTLPSPKIKVLIEGMNAKVEMLNYFETAWNTTWKNTNL